MEIEMLAAGDPTAEGWRLERRAAGDQYAIYAVQYGLPSDRHEANRTGPVPQVRILLEAGDRWESEVIGERAEAEPADGGFARLLSDARI